MLEKNYLIILKSEGGDEQSNKAPCRGNRTDLEMKGPGGSPRENAITQARQITKTVWLSVL